MHKVAVLKIDKDCHVDKSLEQEYSRQSIETLSKRHLRVLWFKATRTKKGSHYYISIDPPVKATKANGLQYLLGDDAERVSLNRSRINSGLEDWNILFEAVGRRLRTIHCEHSRALSKRNCSR